MRAFLVLAVVSAAAAAPTGEDRSITYLEESQRTKKSPGYGGGGQSYGLSTLPSAAPGFAVAAPCAGGAPLAPVTFFALAPQAAAVPGPLHYRENEHMEHQRARANEHARTYYDTSATAASNLAAASAAGGASAGAAGPTIGMFPNVKVSDAVPFLLSCAPTVVSGHLAHQASYAAPAASAYGASTAASAASVAAALAPSAYRTHETSNLEHNIRNADSGAAASMISEPAAVHYSEHALSSMQ